MKTFLRKSGIFAFVFVMANLFFSTAAFGQAAITSDQPDYKPGTIATFTGAGFQPGETVHLQVLHSNIYPEDTGDIGHEPWIVTADANGKFVTIWQVSATHCVSKILRATAVGQSSGENVWHEFTDPLITSTTTGGNWNSGSTWVGGNVPLATDEVAIAVGATVTVTDNTSAYSVSILGGNSSTKLVISSGFKLDVTQNVNINTPSGSGNSNELAVGAGILNIGNDINISGGSNKTAILSISTGTVKVTRDLIGLNSPQSKIIFSDAGLLQIARTFTWGTSAILAAGTGTIEYNGAAQSMVGSVSYYNLLTSGSGVKSLVTSFTVTNTFDIGSGTTLNPSVICTISGGATLIVNGTLDFSNAIGEFRTGSTGTSTLTMGSTGLIRTVDASGLGPIGSGSFSTVLAGTWNTTSISTNGTVEYYLGGPQNVTARTYNNLILSTSGTKTFLGSTTINGNLSISGAIANLGSSNSTSGSLTLGGVGQVNGTWGSTSVSCPAINKNSTYFGTTATGILNVTINTIPCIAPSITTQPSNQTVTYGATSASFSVVASGTPAPTYKWQVNTGSGFTDMTPAQTSSSLTITNPTASMSGYLYHAVITNTCSSVTSSDVSLTVNKAPLTVTADNKGKDYGGADPTLTYTPSGTLYFGDAYSVITGVSLNTATGSAATYGTHPIVATLGFAANYDVSFVDGTLTVTKAALVVTADPQTKVYGAADPALTYTPSGTLYYTDAYSVITAVSLNTAIGSAATYGTHPIVATLGSASNYDVSFVGGTLTVTKAALVVTADPQTKVYGGSDPVLTYTPSGTLYFGDAYSVITGVSLNTATGSAATYGTHPIVATLGSAANYDVSFVDGTLTVSKAALVVTADPQTKVYGGSDPVLTYMPSGTLYYGDVYGVITGVSLNTATGSAATYGTHSIVATLGSASNYDVSFVDGTLTVTKAALVVTADDKGKVYGAAEPTLTYTVGALQYGDVPSVVSGVILNTATGAAATAGTHVIAITGATAPNYTITQNEGTLTVGQAALVVTNTDRSKVYGATLTNADYTGSISGVVAGDVISVTRASIGDVANATVAGSTYPIVGTLVDSGSRLANYDVTNPDGALTVTKASITVVNTDRSKVYGATLTNADYTGSISGVVAGDVISVTRASIGDVANATVAGSTYPIVGTLVDSGSRLANYDVTNPDGALTVTKASITVVNTDRSKVYGATHTNADYTGSISGVVAGDVITVTRASTGDAAGSYVTTYPIVGTLVDAANRAGNYTLSNPDGVLTITKAVLTATADNKSKYCGQTNLPLTFQYSGWVNGVETIDDLPSISTTVNITTIAGNYPDSIVLSGGLDNNYSFSFVAGNFTVNGVSIDANASSTPVPINTAVILKASVSPAVAGVSVTFYKDNVQIGTAVITDGTGLAQLNIGIMTTEVYQIKAVAGSGCAESIVYLPVYDPSGGFVTGGGWINSPAGAYAAGLGLSGKANFGFVAKYKKGSNAVDGNTEFQFHAGSFNFKSNMYDAGTLVISGSKATYRGVGTVNGLGSFGFLVIAVDGVITGGGGSDKFRIKIWDKNNGNTVVYDNEKLFDENDVPTTLLGGGSIVIHQVKKTNARTAEVVEIPAEPIPFNVIAYPNPANYQFTLEVQGGSKEKVDVVLYDVLGRTIKHIESSDGQAIQFGEDLPTGAYFTVVSQGVNQKTVRLIKE